MIAAARPGRLALVGLAVFVATGLVASRGVLWAEVGTVEALNALPDLVIDVLALVMEIGTLPAILLATAIVAVVAPGDWRRAALIVVVSGALSWALSDLAKEIVERPRPSTFTPGLTLDHPASGFGWPSTHTSIATGTLVAAALACRRAPTWALALAGVVGIARMAVGVHLPLDVLGGMALGVAVACGVFTVVRR